MKRFAVACLWLVGCAAKPPAPVTPPPAAGSAADHAAVFVSAELKGYLGPCGCSEAMRVR